ncbi:cytochrome b [Shewanella intestini]|uniref:Cytochrome b n=1 Tax=Shewanella intestini TaxID=2017544 RepID=A0ABS5I346_9GAMM|nr:MULTISPECIES: cytochrome b [Shewanella]MBR9728238.1 cytochrome b [Shewanella intestini]MRG35703.1 cytochrome b [Shewanella sp. XMDDZSB0408]
MFKNQLSGYGIIAILLHWLSAALIIGLFGLGWWMVDLSYYSQWYQQAPHIHKSVGLILLLLTLLRLLWNMVNIKPAPLAQHKKWQQLSARWAQRSMYLIMLSIMFSGVLISTADGRSIWVFDWFELPAPKVLIADQAVVAGNIHQWLAYTLIGLVFIHTLAALKHHFFDKDQTLMRMLKLKNAK